MDISRYELGAALERVVQIALDRNENLHDLPVVQVNHNVAPAESQLLATHIPETGQPLENIFSHVIETILSAAPNGNGPR